VTRLVAAFGVAAITAACGLLPHVPTHADPDTCPPACDRIPDTAWIDAAAIPLFPVYSWPRLPGVAVTAQSPRFRLEEACAAPPVPADPRDYAVAAKAAVANPPGHWQLQVQVLHWRGETWRAGQTADVMLRSAAAALRACQVTAPWASPSITTDEPGRLAAVISVAGPAPVVVHQYLVAHQPSGTIVELALWASSPPVVGWPAVADSQVLDSLVAPLCTAYIGSCR
jgi:hypothetical protein